MWLVINILVAVFLHKKLELPLTSYLKNFQVSQSLRILHICAYTWDIGGPPKVIYDNAVVQLANGAEVTILTPISEGQKLYPVPDGAEIVCCKRHGLARIWAEFSPELYQWLKRTEKNLM
jgi:hypothetical protein